MKKNWLYQKNIILTGVTSGIGKLLAKKLIEKFDCHVIGIGRRVEAMNDFAKELGEKSNLFEGYPFDVSNEENWKRFAKELSEKNMKIVILHMKC